MLVFSLILYVSQSGTTVVYKISSHFICYQNQKLSINKFLFPRKADFLLCYKQFVTVLGSATCLPTRTGLNHH